MEADGAENKKRRAEKQWRREEVEAGLDDRDAPVVEGWGIQVASQQELKARRFVKVRSRGALAPLAETESNPAPAPASSPAKEKEKETKEAKAEAEAKAVVSCQKEHEPKESAESKEEPQKGEDKGKAGDAKGETDEGKRQDEQKAAALPDKSEPKKEGFFFGVPSASAPKPASAGFVFDPSTFEKGSSSSKGGFFFGAKPAESQKEPQEADKKGDSGTTWVCACCTETNEDNLQSCKVCMVPRPAPPAEILDGWTCSHCSKLNSKERKACSSCLVPKTTVSS